MLTRRKFLQASGALALLPLAGCPRQGSKQVPANLVNDVHSQLNSTLVDSIATPNSLESLREVIAAASRRKKSLSIAGARHSMGGQQFATNGVLLDSRGLNRVLSLDQGKGLASVEAGITWPTLVENLAEMQKGEAAFWGIAQKQTGADRLGLGGALSANAHGRGLKMQPIISNVESFTLVDSSGKTHLCSRAQNRELFRLAIGGYGLFGVIYAITLRLVPRQKVQRLVEIITTPDLNDAFDRRIAKGCTYGDFQFMTDESSTDYLRRGVFSCYLPVARETEIRAGQKQVSERAWEELVYLAHTDKARAYQLYSDYYLSSSGQIYWSDTQQIGAYLDGYHQRLDRRMGTGNPASEVITELYVPRESLHSFLEEARQDFLKNGINIIYGTVRLIERDTESFLAWAKQSYACVIFNLHVEHTEQGKSYAAAAFRRLIDMAIRRGGSYYLTYHRHATKAQVLQCYPQFVEFLRRKKHFDPQERFQSDWYRHYKAMFAAELQRS